MSSSFVLLAVHISDGILSRGWIVAGFAVMVVLMLPALWKVGDEEIPRIALLTAVFFVASEIHVRLGPTSVHLLLNGLVGVILGWRAALAIPVGLALQAALLFHGGFYSLGVNACVLTIPALICAGLFALLRRVSWLRHRWFRGSFVGVVLVAWAALVLVALVMFVSNRREDWDRLDLTLVRQALAQPVVWLGLLSLGVLGALVEQRLETTPNMVLGFFVGLTGVLLTLLLNAFTLLVGGAEDWRSIILLVFIAHLPIAVLEGFIMGFIVGFLARVKPELLVGWRSTPVPISASDCQSLAEYSTVPNRSLPEGSLRAPLMLISVITLLVGTTPAWAHRLDAEYKFLPDGRIQVESWFETGDSPLKARVQVFLPGDSLLTEGVSDASGKFVFKTDRSEPLRVVVNAGAGHRKELTIPQRTFQTANSNRQTDLEVDESGSIHAFHFPFKDLLVGIGFLLGAAAFFLSLRNARTLRAIQRTVQTRQREDP